MTHHPHSPPAPSESHIHAPHILQEADARPTTSTSTRTCTRTCTATAACCCGCCSRSCRCCFWLCPYAAEDDDVCLPALEAVHCAKLNVGSSNGCVAPQLPPELGSEARHLSLVGGDDGDAAHRLPVRGQQACRGG